MLLGSQKGWSLLLLLMFDMAASMTQVWADDGDDEWHCVQTLTEANNWY
jgi:cytosolic iron-sulfur protein assembly protein CIAO1